MTKSGIQAVVIGVGLLLIFSLWLSRKNVNPPLDWKQAAQLIQADIPPESIPTLPPVGTPDPVENEPERKFPSIPGAVTRPPQWLIGKAPFDVEDYFTIPADDQNAAAAYLEAFFEFDPGISVCFPETVVTQERTRLADARKQRYQQFVEHPEKNVSTTDWNELVAEHELGFQKLRQAQERPECVFLTGIGLEASFPHVEAARQVIRIAEKRVQQQLSVQSYDQSIETIRTCLKLSRDLRRHSSDITIITCMALDSSITMNMVMPLIWSTELTSGQCDQILSLLLEHDQLMSAHAVDAAKSQYLLSCDSLRILADPQQRIRLRNHFGENGDVVLTSLSAILPDATSEPATNLTNQQNAVVRKFGTADYSSIFLGFFQEYYTRQSVLTEPRQDAMKIIELHDANADKADKNANELVIGLLSTNALFSIKESQTRIGTRLNAMICLTALRRWQSIHHALPTDLAAAIQEAGLDSIPLDEYADSPLKLVTQNGQAIVYSIGLDGIDDRAAKEWRPDSIDSGTGDLLFPLDRKE